MTGERRHRWNRVARSHGATWNVAPDESSFVRFLGSPGRRITSCLAGCPLDDGPQQALFQSLSAVFDSGQKCSLHHCRRGEATPCLQRFSDFSNTESKINGPGGLVFNRGSMVVMRVLALLMFVTGLLTTPLNAQTSKLRVQPASAAAAGVSTGVLDALTLESDQPTILEFSASWCGPCKEMKPQIDELIRKKYPVRVLDADEYPDLRQNYRISKVPTFVIVDPDGREIGRSEGVQQASELASRFRVLKTNWLESRKNQAEVAVEEELPANDQEPNVGSRAARKFGQPGETIDAEHENEHAKPWQTVVRIVVHGGGVMGFGSGTIISSNAQESLILTCAHIFKIENSRQQYAPGQFPRQVTVDLFDGVLRGQGLKTATRGIPARVIDYDFQSDVGLIAISPGYTLPASPVVPANWKPSTNMKMITAGCSGGRDATLWNTNVVKPESKLLIEKKPYEAIECLHEPTQGRSGGGLFTLDHYVAGVCDMAVVGGQRGYYATPNSIHKILARNGFERLYSRQVDDMDRGRMLARNGEPRRSRSTAPEQVRAQSEDDLVLPPPALLGVSEPNSAGLPPAGSMAMVDFMTDKPVKNVPADTKGWNGGTRFRKISDSSESSPGLTLPNARNRMAKTDIAENDLVPIAHDEPEPQPEAMIKPVGKGREELAQRSAEDETGTASGKSSVESGTPRVKLMPVQGLDVDGEQKSWNSRRAR